MWPSCTERDTHMHTHTLWNSCIQNYTCTHIPHDQMKRKHCSASQDLLTQAHTILLLHYHLCNHQSCPCFNVLWFTCFHWLQIHNPPVVMSLTMVSVFMCSCFCYYRNQSCVTLMHIETGGMHAKPLGPALRCDAASLSCQTVAGRDSGRPLAHWAKVNRVIPLTPKSEGWRGPRGIRVQEVTRGGDVWPALQLCTLLCANKPTDIHALLWFMS